MSSKWREHKGKRDLEDVSAATNDGSLPCMKDVTFTDVWYSSYTIKWRRLASCE